MAGIDYTLGLRAGGFTKGLAQAGAQLRDMGATAAKVLATGGLAAGASMGAALYAGIKAAAARETLETAFIPLLGSVQAAKDRMAELSRFAAATPFEMPEIAAASRTLQTMTKGALATGEGLTLVGDVAAGTNSSFEEVAVTIGRLHNALQNNRPAGEALQRLQEIGAVSGDVRARIEQLTASGMGKEAWAAAAKEMGNFTGGMKLQSGTWSGLVSTLADAWNELKVSFGTPIIDSLKPYLEGAIAQLDAMKAKAAELGAAFGDAFGVLRVAFAEGKTFELAGAALKMAFTEAVNVMGKGLYAAFAGLKAALDASGIVPALVALADAIGESISTAILGALAKVKFSGVTEEDVAASRARAGERYGAAQDALNSNIGQIAGQGFQAMQDAWKNSGDLEMVKNARAEYESLAAPLRAQAQADSEARAKAKEEFAAQIAANKPQASAAAAAAATPAPTPRQGPAEAGPNWLEKLGFLGGGMNARASNAAERQVAVAQQQVRLLARIESLLANPEPSAAVF